MEEHIRQAIERHGHGIAIEITNGTSVFSYKAHEARWGKEYLQKISRTPIDCALIYFRDSREYFELPKIDYLCKIRGFEPELAKHALLRVIGRSSSLKDKKLAKIMYSCISRGEKFENLASPPNWREFRAQYPLLVRGLHSPIDYTNEISAVKGAMMEEYIKTVFDQLLPEATKIARHVYRRDRGKADIDLILIGNKKDLHKALTNQHYFEIKNPNVRQLLTTPAAKDENLHPQHDVPDPEYFPTP